MRKRFIGPANPGPDGSEQGHQISVAGRDFGTVMPGDVVEFPDELVAEQRDPKTKAVTFPGVAFPESLWEDAPAAKSKSKTESKDGEG